MLITVEQVLYDGGTVGVVVGTTCDGRSVRVGVDWRTALALAQSLQDARSAEPVEIEVEPWQIL